LCEQEHDHIIQRRITVTVIVTEEFVVRPLQLVRWRLYTVKLSCLRRSINGRNVLRCRLKAGVYRIIWSSVGRRFQARGAATANV